MKKPVYSIGIIFKNEIRCLERCLKSLQPLRDAVPCEVVMADTGSTDGSREIAERYADILFDFPWCDDFSAARNAVMDRCSGRWYFSIDADEWLDEDVSELIAFSKDKKVPRDFAGIILHNYQSPGLEKDQNYQEFTALRMARLSTGVRYVGCIHETWPTPEGGFIPIVTLGKTILYHDGYIYTSKADEKAKHDRNMPLLEKKLAQNPNDIQTLLECIDSSKHFDRSSAEYARTVIRLVEEKASRWDRLGSIAYRSAVSVAKLHHLPELEKWAERGLELFPDSIFTQIDLAYYTFVHYFNDDKYEEAIRWGKLYCQGLENYRTKSFDPNELARGVPEFISPFWERKVSVLMPQVYLELGEPEKALEGIRAVKGGELEDPQQVELCVNMLMRIHRTTQLDATSAMEAFWRQVNEPFPDENKAKMRRGEFLRTASKAFTKNYRAEEIERKDFLRHSFGVFSAMHGSCGLGTAAAMLDTKDTQELEQTISAIENWDEFPIFALAHALECGATFPLPEKPLNVEEMDSLASRLAKDQEFFLTLVDRAVRADFTQSWQAMLWARELTLAAVRLFSWNTDGVDVQQGIAIAKGFSKVENIFLSSCYAPEVFTPEHICVLPPMSRFGWWCGKAFDALDTGDAVGYTRCLREGLNTCSTMKPMVEFFMEHTPELRAPAPSVELQVLAEQIRGVLSRFEPDDPMVAALKQSEAYQKVAYLIEGTEPPVVGGLLQ